MEKAPAQKVCAPVELGVRSGLGNQQHQEGNSSEDGEHTAGGTCRWVLLGVPTLPGTSSPLTGGDQGKAERPWDRGETEDFRLFP